MPPIRVLIVDDSVVVRRFVEDVLSEDPQIEVVGTAKDGRVALAKLTQLSPDLVTLDLEMPEMNGLETLKALRQTHPKLPVIVFSVSTRRGALATLDALAMGATDYATKPANVASSAEGADHIRETLIPKIKALCLSPKVSMGHAKAKTVMPRPGSHVEVVVVGSSTGGPNALMAVVSKLPGDLQVPVLIVQHMPPLFTTYLAERLAQHCALPLVEATAGLTLQPGHVYMAPGDYHIVVVRTGDAVTIQTHQGPPENSCRPAADVLFRSAVDVFGSGTLAVVLTGMGQDGLRGCRLVRAVGGQVIVQDEETSVVWGMPGMIAQAGLANWVLPLPEIASEITDLVHRNRRVSSRETRG